jgi:uncharacterized protein YegP (UPF0339 family)
VSTARYEIEENKAGEWFVRLVGGNGEIVMVSEGYTRESDAKRAISYIRQMVLEEANHAVAVGPGGPGDLEGSVGGAIVGITDADNVEDDNADG